MITFRDKSHAASVIARSQIELIWPMKQRKTHSQDILSKKGKGTDVPAILASATSFDRATIQHYTNLNCRNLVKLR